MAMSFLIFLYVLISQAAVTDQFDLNKEVHLPANVQLNQIEYVDVDRNGNLLITDVSTKSVILYLSDSESFLELDPEDCHPGFSFHPIRAHFIDDEVWVLNRQSEVFLFNVDGSCLGVKQTRFDAPDHFSDYGTDGIAGFKPIRFNLQEPGLTLYDRSLEIVSDEVSLSEDIFAPKMAFRYGGGGMFSHNGNLYFALSSTPIIYNYSLADGQITKTSPEKISDVDISVGEDLNANSDENPASILSGLRDFLSNYTTTINFRKLSKSIAVLYIQQPDQSNREILFFDLESNTFLKDTYIIDAESDEHYQAFANSKAYNVFFDYDEDGWVLQVYDVEY